MSSSSSSAPIPPSAAFHGNSGSSSSAAGTAGTVDAVTLIRERLLTEEPKMDAALKSFASYLMAQTGGCGTAGGNTTTRQQQVRMEDVLAMSRKVSLQINQHVFPVNTTTTAATRRAGRMKQEAEPLREEVLLLASQQEVTAQVWNELVAMKQKPTKSLGRTALIAAWEDLELQQELLLLPPQQEREGDDDWNLKVDDYIRVFYELLTNTSAPDARLIWDADKGRAELARRAADRKIRAAEGVRRREEAMAADPAATASAPFIEELSPGET